MFIKHDHPRALPLPRVNLHLRLGRLRDEILPRATNGLEPALTVGLFFGYIC